MRWRVIVIVRFCLMAMAFWLDGLLCVVGSSNGGGVWFGAVGFVHQERCVVGWVRCSVLWELGTLVGFYMRSVDW